MTSEELRGERPGVARPVGVLHVEEGGPGEPMAEAGRPPLDGWTVVVLVQDADDQRARPRGGDGV